jgi:branched-chain amino acid transport system permease protein
VIGPAGVLVVLLMTLGPSVLGTNVPLADIILIYAVAALGLHMVMGLAGQASIGTAALIGIGAFVMAALRLDTGMGFLPAALIATVAGGAAGALVGGTALRLRGIYLIIGTLALQYITQTVLEDYQVHRGVGELGLIVPPASVFGYSLSSDRRWFYFLAVVVGIAVLVSTLIRQSGVGRRFLAIQGLDYRASVYGISVAGAKILAFSIGGAFAGAAGALFGQYIGDVQYSTFDLNLAVAFVAMLILGGVGSITGALLGTVIVEALPTVLSNWGASIASFFGSHGAFQDQVPGLSTGAYGLLIVLVMSLEPGGLVAVGRRTRDAVRSLLRRSRRRFREERTTPAPRHQRPGLVPMSTSAATTVIPDSPVRPAARLTISGLSAAYGNAGAVLEDVAIDVGRGEIVALLGANGAGKSTLVKSLAGFDPAEHGRVLTGEALLDGENLLRLSSPARAKRGLVVIPERFSVFTDLTVKENLELTQSRLTRRKSTENTDDGIENLLEVFPRLRQRLTVHAGQLSGGERQMLAVARALLRRPEVLIADELSLGLAAGTTSALFSILRGLRDESGMSIVIVEQNAELALEFADYAYALDIGRVHMQGRANLLLNDPEVRKAYLFGAAEAHD